MYRRTAAAGLAAFAAYLHPRTHLQIAGTDRTQSGTPRILVARRSPFWTEGPVGAYDTESTSEALWKARRVALAEGNWLWAAIYAFLDGV